MIEARLRLESRFLMPEARSRSSAIFRASLIELGCEQQPTLIAKKNFLDKSLLLHRLDLFFSFILFPTTSHNIEDFFDFHQLYNLIFLQENTNIRNGKDQGTQDWQQVQA